MMFVGHAIRTPGLTSEMSPAHGGVQLPVRGELAQSPRRPEARAGAVADGLERLADGDVRRRRRRRLLEREDQLRGLAVLSFHGVEEEEVLVGLRIGGEKADLLAKGRFRFVAAAHPRQRVSDVAAYT